MPKVEDITIKARRFDSREEETMDLKTFDLVEIRRGWRCISVRLQDDPPRICISANDRLTIHPVGANWIDVLL